MRKEFLVYGSPLIGKEEINEVVDSLRSGWLGTGPKVEKFENDFKDYINCDQAIAVNSCSAALHLSILVAGIGPEDEVITSAMTFCSTVNAIIHAKATPVLVDCDPVTFCLDLEEIERKINSRTKAIIPVHFAGHACEMDSLVEIADKYGLVIIEDCAHAIETTYKGKHVGIFGDFGCFSFYVTKNVVTGEGGMVIAKEKKAADEIKKLALHGMSADAWKRFSDEGYKHYQVVAPGFKYNMIDIQAALGIHQLKRIEQNWLRRREIWLTYHEELKDLPLTLPAIPPETVKHAYHLFPILIHEDELEITRNQFISAMIVENIGVGVHYRSIPSHVFYRKTYGWKPEDYPVSHRIGERTLSLPLSPKLSGDDINDVVQAVSKICGAG